MKTIVAILALVLCQLCAAQEEELQESLVNDEKNTLTMKKEFDATGKNVAFGASLGITGYIGPYSIDTTLVYRNVFVNTGYFNPATGIFLTPVKGVYSFSFSGVNLSSRAMSLRLMKNGYDVVTIANQPAGNRYEAATNSMTLTLAQGDHIYIRLLAGTWIYDDAYNRSTFSGFLLFTL